MPIRPTLLSLCLVLPLPAQKMPAPGDGERIVAVYSIAEAVERAMVHAGDTLRGHTVPPETMRAECRNCIRNAISCFLISAAARGRPRGRTWTRSPGGAGASGAGRVDRCFFRRLLAADLAARLDGAFERIILPAARLAEIVKQPALGDHAELLLDAEQLKALRTGTRERGGPLSTGRVSVSCPTGPGGSR